MTVVVKWRVRTFYRLGKTIRRAVLLNRRKIRKEFSASGDAPSDSITHLLTTTNMAAKIGVELSRHIRTHNFTSASKTKSLYSKPYAKVGGN